MNLLHPTTQHTKNGIEKTSTSEHLKKDTTPTTEVEVKPSHETPDYFEWRVSSALSNGEKWIETDEDTITQILRSDSWKKQGYFNYKNLFVCARGKTDSVQQQLNMKTQDILHPDTRVPGVK